MERTLSIIKPDAVKKNVVGKIIDRFESNGLRIVAIKKLLLSRLEAKQFYIIHKNRPFFNDLLDFMISGPVIVMVLEGDLSLIHISEPTRPPVASRMPSSA